MSLMEDMTSVSAFNFIYDDILEQERCPYCYQTKTQQIEYDYERGSMDHKYRN